MCLSVPSRTVSLALAAMVLAGSVIQADPPKKEAVAPPMAALDTRGWLKASVDPLKPGEIDQLIGEQLKKVGVKPAKLANDELFMRRAYLDLTGRLPMP